MKSLTVLIADDHNIVHLGLSMILRTIRPEVNIEIAVDFPTVIRQIKKQVFDLIIMDVNMPGGNFQSTLAIIKSECPEVKVLAFSSADEKVFAPRYILQGANGFLNKLSTESVVQGAIESVLTKGEYLSPEVKDTMVYNALRTGGGNQYKNPLEVLTDREIEIATLLIQGDSLKEITQKLFIHVSTVSTYKTRVFQKLNIKSVPELISIFSIYNSQ